jgi:UPF0755 protein
MTGNDDYWGDSGHYPPPAPVRRGGNRRFSSMARSPAEALEPDHAPEPPRGSKVRHQHPIFIFLNTFITLLLAGMIGLGGAFYFVRTQFDRPGPLDHSKVIVIPDGAGSSEIARLLEDEGIISDRRIFRLAVLWFHTDKSTRNKSLKAGEFAIKANASIREVHDTLVDGQPILYKVNIPEGLTTDQIMERLQASPDLLGSISEVPAEGTLLPDTYKFPRSTTRDDIIRRMKSEQARYVEHMWSSRFRDLPVSTPSEAIILASIVEKETGKADERYRVAAVFVNRLRKKMRLDSDPTVIYGITQGRGPLGRGLTRSELQQETAYNTYRIHGLPPTPICNPGREAINAVLKPARSGDLFFVADGRGGHVFAENLREHNQNVERWRAIENERAQQARAQVVAAEDKSSASAMMAKPVPVDIAKLPVAQIPMPQRRPAH